MRGNRYVEKSKTKFMAYWGTGNLVRIRAHG